MNNILRKLILLVMMSCNNNHSQSTNNTQNNDGHKVQGLELVKDKPSGVETPKGMVWIPGGEFTQG